MRKLPLPTQLNTDFPMNLPAFYLGANSTDIFLNFVISKACGISDAGSLL
jgi:hypothetical protein